MYKTLLRPILFSLFKDPESAHQFVIQLLALGQSVPGMTAMTQRGWAVFDRDQVLAQTVFGLQFPNPIGLAAGFDKHAQALSLLAALGFGHIEVGTVTRHAQPGNPRPRMFRLVADEALINRMGFNNGGADAMARALARYKKLPVPIGISLGKSKTTPIEKALEDYLYSFRTLYMQGDYFALNVSSPNTPGLRTLQDRAALEHLVAGIQEANTQLARENKLPTPKPLLVKIAPDLTLEAVDEVLHVCQKFAVSGIIATNTTVSRDNLKTATSEEGGLSGRPLYEQALSIVRHIHRQSPALPIIGSGGIFTPEHAYAFIRAGASLVQAYTGFIYQGPGFARDINQGLLQFLRRDGFSSVTQAVGKGE